MASEGMYICKERVGFDSGVVGTVDRFLRMGGIFTHCGGRPPDAHLHQALHRQGDTICCPP